MKLLVVTNGFPPRGQWGTEFYTLQLVSALRDRGIEVAVLHPERSGQRPRYTLERIDQDGVQIHLLHNPGDPSKDFADSYRNAEVERIFGELLDSFQPDLIHFTYLLWGLSARLPRVAQERGVPTVVTLTDYGLLCHRGQMFDWRLRRCFGPHPADVCAKCIREPSAYDAPPLTRMAKRLAVRASAALGGFGRVVTAADLERRAETVRAALEAVGHFIVPTRVLADVFSGYGISSQRMTELCYAIDDRPLEAARPIPGGSCRFGFLGQFTPHKGLATLLEAVGILERRLPESVEPWDVRLYGAAAGGRHRRFAEEMFRVERGPRVKLRPAFAPTRAADIFAKLHAVILPSLWDENAPLTVLQARSAGVPVIGSDVPGIAEVVEPGVHGRLFPVGDALGLADAMGEQILHGPARTGIHDMPMTLDEHVRRVEEIYARLLGRSIPGGGPNGPNGPDGADGADGTDGSDGTHPNGGHR